jgi:hypothetical protein
MYFSNLTKKTELYILVATDLVQKELELNSSYKTNPEFKYTFIKSSWMKMTKFELDVLILDSIPASEIK